MYARVKYILFRTRKGPLTTGARRYTRNGSRFSRQAHFRKSIDREPPFRRSRTLVNLPYNPPGVCRPTRWISVNEKFLTTDVAFPNVPSPRDRNILHSVWSSPSVFSYNWGWFFIFRTHQEIQRKVLHIKVVPCKIKNCRDFALQLSVTNRFTKMRFIIIKKLKLHVSL